LLHNNTIEIHSIHTQEIVQVIHLPSSSSPLALQPRSLVYSWTGLDLGSATGAIKLESTSVPLLPSPSAPSWPTTPTKAGRMSISAKDEGVKGKGKGTATRTLIVGKNSLYGLTPLTLVVQADALMEKGRVEDALALADQLEKSGTGGVEEVSSYSILSFSMRRERTDVFRAFIEPRARLRLPSRGLPRAQRDSLPRRVQPLPSLRMRPSTGRPHVSRPARSLGDLTRRSDGLSGRPSRGPRGQVH
jgi:hypothetical protein